jgi:putative transposase
MPRPARIEVSGVPLHIVQRGNNRSGCFFSDLDRRFYLKCLREIAAVRRCEIHAYVLMDNHVHLLATPDAVGGVSAMMQDLGRRYVRNVNSTHARTGTLWEGRFKSSLIDTERYLFTCHRYIELNPVRAGIVKDPGEYPWSSHAYYSEGVPDRLVTPHHLYAALGASPEARMAAFRAMFEDPVPEADVEHLRVAVNKGWALGSDDFLDTMERKLGRSIRPPRRGRPKGNGEPAIGDQTEMLP